MWCPKPCRQAVRQRERQTRHTQARTHTERDTQTISELNTCFCWYWQKRGYQESGHAACCSWADINFSAPSDDIHRHRQTVHNNVQQRAWFQLDFLLDSSIISNCVLKGSRMCKAKALNCLNLFIGQMWS